MQELTIKKEFSYSSPSFYFDEAQNCPHITLWGFKDKLLNDYAFNVLGLSPSLALLYVKMASLCFVSFERFKKFQCCCSKIYLAKSLNLSLSTIKRSIKKLISLGVFAFGGIGKNQRNIYFLKRCFYCDSLGAVLLSVQSEPLNNKNNNSKNIYKKGYDMTIALNGALYFHCFPSFAFGSLKAFNKSLKYASQYDLEALIKIATNHNWLYE